MWEAESVEERERTNMEEGGAEKAARKEEEEEEKRENRELWNIYRRLETDVKK